VCVNEREVLVYALDQGRLDEHKVLPLATARREGIWPSTKLAFVGDDVLLVAREMPQIRVSAFQIATGNIVGGFEDEAYGPMFAPPLLLSTRHVLISAAETAICIDLNSFREVFRIRRLDEDGLAVDEDDFVAGEQVSPNGIAYDSRTGFLYVLWRSFVNSFLQTYRLDLEGNRFERLQRRLVLEGFEGNGLCLSDDGTRIAGWFTTVDETVDCRTEEGMKMPEMGRLGRLGALSPTQDRFIDVHTKIELHPWLKCDFEIQSAYSTDPQGNVTEIGIRYGVESYTPKPFFLDDHTVVINTPGGSLIGVDSSSGASRVLYNVLSPLRDLCFHPGKRLLLLATESGALKLCSL
jgi:hypothetical protein